MHFQALCSHNHTSYEVNREWFYYYFFFSHKNLKEPNIRHPDVFSLCDLKSSKVFVSQTCFEEFHLSCLMLCLSQNNGIFFIFDRSISFGCICILFAIIKIRHVHTCWHVCSLYAVSIACIIVNLHLFYC